MKSHGFMPHQLCTVPTHHTAPVAAAPHRAPRHAALRQALPGGGCEHRSTARVLLSPVHVKAMRWSGRPKVCTMLRRVFFMSCLIPSPKRFVQSASCVFGQSLMEFTRSLMKLTSRHEQERLDLLMCKTEFISTTRTKVWLVDATGTFMP